MAYFGVCFSLGKDSTAKGAGFECGVIEIEIMARDGGLTISDTAD